VLTATASDPARPHAGHSVRRWRRHLRKERHETFRHGRMREDSITQVRIGQTRPDRYLHCGHGLCRKVAILRKNAKFPFRRHNNLQAATFLFSVICDRAAPLAWRIPLSFLTVSGVIAGYIDDPSHFTERQSYLFE